jgi:hypothetical protein
VRWQEGDVKRTTIREGGVLVPMTIFQPIVEGFLRGHSGREEAFATLGSHNGISPDGWRKRLREEEWGWLGKESLPVGLVDEFLVAANLEHMWHAPPLLDYSGARAKIHCHDCGAELTVDNYRPLDLFRHVPDAPGGIVWDSTKQKWVKRPRNAARGGRRFRRYDLCRRCAGEALRKRSLSGTVMEGGKKRTLRRRERVPPKRGGRPRLLNEQELRQAHAVYVKTRVSIGEVSRRLLEAGRPGTPSGMYQCLLYGWRRLGLPIRSRVEQTAITVHGTDGTLTRSHRVRCSSTVLRGKRKGRRCTQFVRRVTYVTGSHPAEDGLCWNHAHYRRQ